LVQQIYHTVDLRLTNAVNGSGELEYLSTSGWVPVCHTSEFDKHAADVACHQLGYPFAAEFGQAIGSGDGIGITSSSCEGSSSQYLLKCVEFEKMACQFRYHLTCFSKYYNSFCININEIKYTLANPTVRLVGGPVEHMGRVEVYDRVSGQWGTICYNDVTDNSHIIGSVVCNSLGRYYTYDSGPANLSYNIQLSTNHPIVNGPIDCGTHSNVHDHFYQCPSFQLNSTDAMSRCTPDQEWVMVCSCKSYFMNLYTYVYTYIHTYIATSIIFK